jgi:uncharacterized protein (TIGR03067 family)
MKRVAVVFVLGLCAVALGRVWADDDKDKALKEELKRLDGTWEVVARVADGKEVTLSDDEKAQATVKDGKFTLRLGGREAGQGSLKLDPSAKPKAIDIIPEGGEAMPGVYELKGDELKVCRAAPGSERPKKVESKEGSGHILDTWKRAKK